MSEYIPTIGMEVHVQLNTKSKMFCSCAVAYDGIPNTRICPICMGHPGTMPTINQRVVEFAIRAGIALNCTINKHSDFARKNYFYPDLPKGYQITQFHIPIAENGYIELDSGKKIHIRRLHIEEDTGKLIHDIDEDTLVDFNRAGVPLIEIVTEPDIENADEAVEYLTKFKQIIRYIEVSNADMEKGQLRCEPNISIRKQGEELGIKTEIKNLNSFKAVHRGINAEIKRQKKKLESGERIISETLLYNEKTQDVIPMRQKESIGDYRYFSEPDLPDLIIDDELINRIKLQLPELPKDKYNRFLKNYKLSNESVKILTADKYIADFYEESIKDIENIKKTSNFFIKEIPAILNKNTITIKDIGINALRLNELLKFIESEKINLNTAKKILEEMYKTKENAGKIIERLGLIQTTNEDEIKSIIESVINENPKEVERYKNGEKKLFGFLVGQIMKKSKGKANPKIVNDKLEEILK